MGALVTVAVILGIAVGILRLRFHGPALAETIVTMLNSDIRGRVEAESVEWPLSSLPVVVTGGWLPVTVRGLKVYDDGGNPDEPVDDSKRELVLQTEYATAYIDAHALMFGHHDFIIRDLRAPDGGYAFIKEVREPYPLHEYDTHVVSLASAFYSYLEPGFRAGVTAHSAPIFDIQSFSGDNVTVEILFPTAHVIVEGASAEGFVKSDFSDPLHLKVYYALAPTAVRGAACLGNVWPDERKRLGKMYPRRPADAGPEYDYRAAAELCRGKAVQPNMSQGEFDTIYPVPLEDIQASKLIQLPFSWPRDNVAHDVEWDVRGRTPDGAWLHFSGALRDYWVGFYGGDFDDVRLTVESGGSLIHHLTDGLAGGDDLQVEMRATGPSIGPKFEVDMAGLDIRMPLGEPPLDLHFKRTRVVFDMVTEEGTVAETMAIGAGGEVELAASFALDPLRFEVDTNITRSIDVSDYLPPELAEVTGERLRGRLHVTGNGDRYRMNKLNLWLGRARITGELAYDESKERLSAQRLGVRVADSELTSSGSYHVVDGTFNVGMRVSSSDLGQWLRRFDVPAVASGLQAQARLTGTADDPRVKADLTVSGVPVAQSIKARLRYADDVVAIEQAESQGGAGRMWANGNLRVSRGGRLDGFKAGASNLDLSKIPVIGSVMSGRVDVSARASGPLGRLDSQVDLDIATIDIAGDQYSQRTTGLCAAAPVTTVPPDPAASPGTTDARPGKTGNARPAESFTLRTLPSGETELRLCLGRDRGPGEFQARATLGKNGQLVGKVEVDKVPLHDLDILGGRSSSPIGGVISASLDLAGSDTDPLATGQLSWLDSWFGDAFLGAGVVDIELLEPAADDPGAVPRIGIKGSVMQGDVTLSAAVDSVAPYEGDVTLQLRRVGLDRLFPALSRDHGINGWITGELDARTALIPTADHEPTANLTITEIELWMSRVDSYGRPAPIRLRNKASTPIDIAFDGTRAVLQRDVVLVGPGNAEFVLSGNGSLGELALSLSGNVALSIFEPYMRQVFDSMEGTIGVQAEITGPLFAPRFDISLQILEQVSVRPEGQDALIRITSGGLVKITNDQVTPTGLEIVVDDPYTGERAALEVRGGIRLEEFQPRRLGLDIDGELSGKLLLVALPEYFSRASGAATLQVSVRGDPNSPRIDGEIAFNDERPLGMAVRGLRHEIRLNGGSVTFRDESVGLGVRQPGLALRSLIELEVQNLVGTIADEGQITDLSGDISMVDWQPDSVDITMSADSLPFRIQKQLDLTVNIADLNIVGDANELSIGGDGVTSDRGIIEVVDGRYVRNFNLITDVLRPEASDDSQTLFYDSIPLLADAKLELLIETRGFFVQNNVANIELVGEVEITGTPREPRLDGEIQVVQGEFNIPVLRASFTRTSGAVSFSSFKEFPESTPTLDVKSESDYRDPSGQEHLITLSLEGPLNALKWDLFTSSGLNKGQTIVLMTSGRTPEEFRQQLGDTAPGLTSNRVATSTDPNEGAADEILRELAGDFISLYIGDKLRTITNLDVARLEIGTGSIGFHGEKKFFSNLRLLGDFEQTLRGRTYDVRGEVRLSDRTSVEGKYLSKDFEDDSEEDFTDRRLRAVFRFFFP